MKLIFILSVLFLSSSLFAGRIQERVELMKYAIKLESKLPHETKWKVSWLEQWKLIEEAYAYREGETCLVLGFKSQYQNGKCRLSSAEGIKDYKKQCEGGSLPCNPQVFGKPSADKPFCIPASSGNELSKVCAKETFNHLAAQSKSPALKDVASMSAKDFDLDKIDLSQIDQPLSDAFAALYKSDDSDLESAVKFTKELCEDLKLSTKSGHQPFDLKTCQSHLALLEKGNAPVIASEKKQVKEEEKDKVEENKTVQMDLPDEECVDPLLDKKTDENIKDVQKITTQSEGKAWLACINQIEKQKTVAKQLVDIAENDKSRDRYFGYWHDLDGEKQFGLLCDPKSDEDPQEIFTFLGTNGFSQVKVPTNEYTGVVARMSSNGKEYYIVQDMMGEYFELHEKDKLKSAPKGTQEDVRLFHKQGKGTLSPLQPVPADQLDQAKMCIRQRIDEYVNWITYPNGVLPNVKEYNADVGVYNSQSGMENLKKKYARTVDDIKKEEFEKVMKDAPECKGILSEEAFSQKYDKDHADRIKLYNQFRGYLGLVRQD